MSNEIEAIWLQVYIPHLKPLLVGCCYRPCNTNSGYLDKICDMIDKVGDFTNEMFLLGDLNINWNAIDCPLKNELHSITDACGLTQVVTEPTRVWDKMSLADNAQSYFNIRNQIMAGKKCEFRFTPVTVSQVEK